MSAREFPGMDQARQRASKAIDVLQSAIEQLTPPRNGEDLETLALRLRGSAILAFSAGLELAMVSGVHSAAHDCAQAGLLDTENDDP